MNKTNVSAVHLTARHRNAFISVASITTLFLSAAVAPLIAGAPAAQGEATAEEKLRKPYYLTGDWGGRRQTLEEMGVTFDIFETFDFYSNVSGGDTSVVEYFHRTRFTLDIDLEKLVGWKGAEFFVTGVSQDGQDFAHTKINVFTNPSSIEGEQTTRLAEVWLQQKFFGDKLALKFGKLDGVGEFGLQEIGSTFMNDELNYVMNLTFTTGISFDPAGKPGAVLTLKPFEEDFIKGFYWKGGIFAGNHNNAYFQDESGFSFAIRDPAIAAGEFGWRTPEGSNLLPGVYKIGLHYNFGDAPHFDGTIARGNHYLYANVSQTLCYIDAEKTRHWDAGFTIGGAPDDRNRGEFAATAILRLVGPFEARPKDEVGLGFIVTRFSDQSVSPTSRSTIGEPNFDGSEKTIEFTYKARIGRWLVLQPDFQVIFDPQGDSSRDTVFILGMRTMVYF